MAPKSVRSAVLARDPTALTPNTAGGGISSAHVGKFTKAVKRSRRIPSSSPSDSGDDDKSDDTPAPRVLPPVAAAAAAAAAGSSSGPLVPISRPALLAKKKVELPAKDDAENVRKKLKTRLRAIALDGESEQDVLRRLHAEAEVVIDITNPFTKSHRDSCRRYWQAYVQEMQVPEVSWYFKDTFHTLGPAFIDMRARTTPGRYDKYIKAVTLEGIFLHFITVISMYCHDEDYNRCGVHQLSRFHLYEDLAVKVESLIRELELNRYRTEVVRWGRLEVQLVIEQALANTSKAGRMAALQTITILTIAFATAVRPGALMCSHPDYIKRKRYLTMRDLKISRAKATGSFSVVIDFCVMKGNASGARGDKLTFCLEPVTKAHNIIFEPSLYIVLFLFHRGALKVDSYEELLTGARTQVRIRDEFLARPMFCAVDQAGKLIEDSPAMTHTGSDAIARIAKNAGLSSGGGLYAIRRETGDNFGVRFGSVFAAKMLNHKVGSDPHVFRKHYSRDLANYPVVQLRLGEFDHTLDDVQRYRLDMYRLEQDAVLTILVRSRAPDARPTQRGSISAPAPVLTDVDKKAIDDGLQDCWRKIDVEYAYLLSLLIDRGSLLPATLPRKGNKPMWEKKLARSTFDPANEDAIAATTYRLDALYRDKNTQSRQLTKARDAASQKRTAAEAREQFLDQHDTRQDREAAATSLEDPSALYAKIFVETRRKPELAEGCVLPAFPIEGSQAEWEAYMIAAARIAAVRDDEYAPDSADIAHARQHLHVEVQRKLNDIPVFFNPAKGKKAKRGKAKKGKGKKGKKSKAKKGKSKKGKGKATDASDASEMEDEQPEETFEDLELFDDADEEDCLSTLDITRLRITLMDFVRLPILREQDERDRYLRDGKWCCDHPDCEYEFPQPKLLFRHLPTHAEWPVLQDSLPREPDRKYTCPAHDEPKFRNRSKQAVYEHMVSLDCVDRERHIDLLFDYREMLLAARGLKSIENALSATEALLVHANAILPSDVSPEWERTRREKAVMPAPEGPTGDDDDDDDEDEEVQEVPAPDPKEPSILSVLQTITPAHLHARAKELGRNPTPQQQRAVEDGWDAMLDALKTVEDGDDDAREVTDEEWAEFHIKMARAA